MKRLFFILFLLIEVAAANAQYFPTTDSLRIYNLKYITTNPQTAFTNRRLNTLLAGMINWIDTARLGAGATIGVDTIYALNDSTVRYRKSGVFRNFNLKGIYENRRKVDSAYALNDSTVRFIINGSSRDVVIPGNTTLLAKLWELDGSNNLVPKSFAGSRVEISRKQLRLIDSGFVAIGVTSGIHPSPGTGTKMFWHPGKGALRVGVSTFNSFNESNIGSFSFASGADATASGSASVAMGNVLSASGIGAVALGGGGTSASGLYSVAIGSAATATQQAAVAIGLATDADGTASLATGNASRAEGEASAAFNKTTRAIADFSASFGEGSETRADAGFTGGAFTLTNTTTRIPQFSIGAFNDTTNAGELFRIGWRTGTTGRFNIFAVDTLGRTKVGTLDDGNTNMPTVVWDDTDSLLKKVPAFTAPVSTSSAGTLNLSSGGVYVFTGTTTTWTLPAVSGTTGRTYWIKNRGSGNITLNADSGSNEIYDSAATNTVSVTPGSTVRIVSDGTYFLIL